MSQQIDRKTLMTLLQTEDIAGLSFHELVRLFQEEELITNFLPEGIVRVDPRNGDMILYNSSRGRRPLDPRLEPSRTMERETECVICRGKTTGIIDVADLSEGFTFINKNLFPILYPLDIEVSNRQIKGGNRVPGPRARSSYGFHFIQWTSSQHDKDWQNMPLADCVIVMKRLAALEKKLILDYGAFLPARAPHGCQLSQPGFVLIIKNYGRLVGASLSHGHQQIAFSNVMPRRMQENIRFEREGSEPFSAYMLRENPPELVVKDYGPAILLAPYFMRRPYDMMLLVKDTSKMYLHELTDMEITAVAEGWHDAIKAIHLILPEIGKEVAFNVTTSNGPGAGLYFEFLPHSQFFGGFEQLGLVVCQEMPERAAIRMRNLLGE